MKQRTIISQSRSENCDFIEWSDGAVSIALPSGKVWVVNRPFLREYVLPLSTEFFPRVPLDTIIESCCQVSTYFALQRKG